MRLRQIPFLFPARNHLRNHLQHAENSDSYSNMQKPEISGLFGNILRVNLNGAKGAKAEISLDNGKTLKLFLKEKSPNYSDNRIKLGIFAGISGIILVFMIIKRRKNAKTMGRSF